MHFYHVKVGKPECETKNRTSLKEVIENMSTVGDLLIFNTDESPYFGSQTKTANYVEQNRNNSEKSFGILDAAPSSITNRGQILKSEVDEYLYTPGMGNVSIKLQSRII